MSQFKTQYKIVEFNPATGRENETASRFDDMDKMNEAAGRETGSGKSIRIYQWIGIPGHGQWNLVRAMYPRLNEESC